MKEKIVDRLAGLLSREFLLPLTAIVLGFVLFYTGKVLATPQNWAVYLGITIGSGSGYAGFRNIQRFIESKGKDSIKKGEVA